MTSPASPPDPRTLARATAGAALVAALVLVTAILPAEYGLDPTGVGRLTGLARLSETQPAAGVEVQTEEDGIRTLHAIDAAWRVLAMPVATQEGFTEAPYGETQVNLPLAISNLTMLTAVLSWNDTDRVDGQRTEPDLFELSIDGPGGRESQLVRAQNEPAGEGSIMVELPWRSVPAPERAGDGLRLPILEPDTSSHGNWTFTIRLYDARGLPNHSAKDPGNDWTLTITAQTYELVLRESEGFAGDRVTLTLNPNQGVEYKFHMQTGATLRYQWQATAPVYWDLHAEEDGKDPEDFKRFEEGTSEGERGSATASFAGRHGWYFLNRGTQPLTITLETTGEYTILGVV